VCYLLARDLTLRNMSPEKALPVESLLPFPKSRSDESVPSYRQALNGTKDETEDDSQPDDDVSDSGKPSRRPKRARACIACRNMKIRCLPVDGQEACLGCSKVNRECIMPGPARKRQKTVHKVAELEKKINALTDALLAKNAANPTPPGDSPASQRPESQADVSRTSSAKIQSPDKTHDPLFDATSRPPVWTGGPFGKSMPGSTKMQMNCWSRDPPPPETYIDIIDRGMLDIDTATAMFNHYVTSLAPCFPIIAFPSYVKCSDVRTARPMVFLAILSISSAAIRPDLQQDLIAEVSRQLSERVMFMGEKSLDLVQSMQIYTTYYVRSRYAKDLAFNQYIHAAVVMCLELGMGKKYPIKVNRNEVEEAEVRRTWMACYYFATRLVPPPNRIVDLPLTLGSVLQFCSDIPTLFDGRYI
jgi:Fungal specific transcription factor domain/Fungal Zn(2)-Cys(6) binuclear cluster domain